MNFKDIHIGNLISARVLECAIEMNRICTLFKCSENQINKVFQSKSIDSSELLKWSKLLGYDFFRVYSQHLIFYSPQSSIKYNDIKPHSSLPKFRKNIYTKEIIEFVIEEINSGNMTKKEIIEKYGIPKTTLYKWLKKYEYQKEKTILNQQNEDN